MRGGEDRTGMAFQKFFLVGHALTLAGSDPRWIHANYGTLTDKQRSRWNAGPFPKDPKARKQEDFPANDGKDKAAQSLGQRGGKARARPLSSKRRSEIARKAAARRWGKR
jgi:hypothetical protein